MVKVVLVVMWLVVPKGMHHAFIQHLLPAMKTSAPITQRSHVTLPDKYIKIFFSEVKLHKFDMKYSNAFYNVVRVIVLVVVI